MSEVCMIGPFSVLHEVGARVVTVSGRHHSERLDLVGWRSRLRLYSDLRDRAGGRYAKFYAHKVQACALAIEALS